MNYIKTTLLGGLFILLPLMLLWLGLQEIAGLLIAMATPIADLFPKGPFEDLAAPGVGGPVDLSGTKVPGVSETSINTWARWSFDLGSSMDGFVRAEYYYESDTQVISNVPETPVTVITTVATSVAPDWSVIW